jgi:hypothetical protein
MTELAPFFLPFVLLLASALGWGIRHALPDHHRTHETTEAVRLLLGMLVTFSALVLGLLTTSAKTHFDNARDRFQTYSIDLITLDQRLREYGPDADAARALLRAYTAAAIADTWPNEPPPIGTYPSHPGHSIPNSIESLDLGAMLLALDRQIGSLTPSTLMQQTLSAALTTRMATTLQDRWVLIGSAQATMSWPFLSIMSGWLVLVFAMFGLSVRGNSVVYAVVSLAALSLSVAVWLIVELDNPLSGFLGLPSAALREALFHIDAAF